MGVSNFCTPHYNNVMRCTEISDTHARFACHIKTSTLHTTVLLLLYSLFYIHEFFILILLSGDVEVNPGPDSVESSTDSSDILSSASFNSIANHLSILHLTVQSLLPKIDLIRGEAIAHAIFIFTESWLKPTINDDSIHIENFLPPFRTDICERPDLAVIVYVRDTLSSIQAQI